MKTPSLLACLAVLLVAPTCAMLPRESPPPDPQRILVLGGTGFLGPHVVEAAIARGHRVTLFNRGKTNPGLFPDLEQLHGDRDGDLTALEGRSWDAVVDTSGYVPRVVGASARLLAPAVRQYLFISTISVFAEPGRNGLDEHARLETLEDPTNEDVRAHYGALKALCEQAVEDALPGRTTVIRPGLIVGPGDPTDRFTYWPARAARGGEILAPGDGLDPVQVIDARDLAEFVVRCIERRTVGVFNATGPERPLPMRQLVETCVAESGVAGRPVWVPAAFLAEQGVGEWSDMPAWMSRQGEYAGMGSVDCRKAIAAGLAFRPIAATVRDTLAWHRARPPERQAALRAGLAPDREQAVLAAWAAHER